MNWLALGLVLGLLIAKASSDILYGVSIGILLSYVFRALTANPVHDSAKDAIVPEVDQPSPPNRS